MHSFFDTNFIQGVSPSTEMSYHRLAINTTYFTFPVLQEEERPRWRSGKVSESEASSLVFQLVWCGSLERGCQFRRRPRHLTTVENYEVRPKIGLVLFQNGRLV
ncbi:hypothetical protein AVEN_247776-1 [Araneus ventricosus]|uniref:Uncharacterized protein n=1 Tax=Araneus ventricosus TaxID=182803 RepID=A0A4Y2W5Z3_ARAVE|nr:hypothetical protein AVEN_247776-1 [Araneus ventricosus]